MIVREQVSQNTIVVQPKPQKRFDTFVESKCGIRLTIQGRFQRVFYIPTLKRGLNMESLIWYF